MKKHLICILLLWGSALANAAQSVTVKQDALRQAVESYLQTRSAGSGVQLVLKRLGGLADQQLPTGTVTYEVIAPQQWSGWGKASLALVIRVDEQVVRNLSLQADVEGWREVLVASRPLERGDIISSPDLIKERRNLALVQGVPLVVADEAIGKRVRTTIKQGAPLQGNHVEKVMVVAAGQQVTILLENETLQLSTTGRAKGPGAPGDLIQVQNLVSQKVIPARVVNAQTVKVEF
jgi:flagella basal body P-ring formation protein FlgA